MATFDPTSGGHRNIVENIRREHVPLADEFSDASLYRLYCLTYGLPDQPTAIKDALTDAVKAFCW